MNCLIGCRMFSAEAEDGTVRPDDFRSLLYISYKLSMDHYPEGPQTCIMVRTMCINTDILFKLINGRLELDNSGN